MAKVLRKQPRECQIIIPGRLYFVCLTLIRPSKVPVRLCALALQHLEGVIAQ